MRGVSLEEISAATRISTRFLEAIEKDQWEQLPGGVFNRGFIRSIARFLGLDEDSLVAEYALVTATSTGARAVPERPAEMPRNWRPVIAAIVIVIVLIAAGVLGFRRYGAAIAAHFHRHSSAASAGAGDAAQTAEPGAPQSADPAGGSASAAGGAPAAAGDTPATDGLQLKLEATKPSDVRVIADGKAVFDGAVQANDVKQFGAADTFEVTSSESSALVLELNGQAVPPIGTPGQAGSVTLTRNDLKSPTGGTH